jgi:hypothetical protein
MHNSRLESANEIANFKKLRQITEQVSALVSNLLMIYFKKDTSAEKVNKTLF